MLVLKVNYGINKSNENVMALTEQHITQDCKYFRNVCFLCTAILVYLLPPAHHGEVEVGISSRINSYNLLTSE